MSISRRAFLSQTGKVAAAYPAMLALGMLPPAPAHAFDLQGTGNGKRIVILGAGLAGLTAATTLSRKVETPS